MITKPIQYIKEAQVEIKKVTWPSKKQSLQYTAIVVIISIASTIILGGLDILFNYILTQFIL
ncbi:MAG: SecE/Sec61-gamma subunit of protein translocation complex [Candidatus Parcubacteria bacterium]|jgi:preprotein translocase subunit SecE